MLELARGIIYPARDLVLGWWTIWLLLVMTAMPRRDHAAEASG